MFVTAVAAPFDGAAEQGRAAGFNGLHQTMLLQRQGMGLPVSRAVLSKDAGQLQGWRWHGSALGRLRWFGFAVERVERAEGGGDHLR